MAKHNVQILIKARDEASKNIARIARSVTGFGGLLRKAAAAAALYFGGRGIYRFLKGSVDLAAEHEDAEQKLKQALEATGGAVGFNLDQLKEYADQLQDLTIYGNEANMEAMSILATFKQIKGDAFKETTELALDMSYALKQDVKSSIIQVGKALNDPATGLSALSRVGVSFTQQQKDMVKQMVQSNDVLGAQRIILDELASEFGGQAKSVDTYRGAMAQMQNAIGDVRKKIGNALIPSIKQSGIRIKEWAQKNQDKIGEWAEKTVEAVKLVKDLFVDYVKYMKTDWKAGLTFALDASLKIFAAWGKSMMVMMEKLTIDLENNLTVWLKRGAAQKIAFKTYEKQYLQKTGAYGGGGMIKEAQEYHRGRAREYARGMLAKDKQFGLYEKMFPTQESITWKDVLDDTKQIFKDTLKGILANAPKELKDSMSARLDAYRKATAELTGAPGVGVGTGGGGPPGPLAALAAAIQRGLAPIEGRLLTFAPGQAAGEDPAVRVARQQLEVEQKSMRLLERIASAVSGYGVPSPMALQAARFEF